MYPCTDPMTAITTASAIAALPALMVESLDDRRPPPVSHKTKAHKTPTRTAVAARAEVSVEMVWGRGPKPQTQRVEMVWGRGPNHKLNERRWFGAGAPNHKLN